MRQVFLIALILLSGCTKNIDGFWINSEKNYAFRVTGDTLIEISLYLGLTDTSLYYLNENTITFISPNSGNSDTYQYILERDTLLIWSDMLEYRSTFVKTKLESYKDFFLSPGLSKIILPRIDSSVCTPNRYLYFDIKIALENGQPIYYVDDNRVFLDDLPKAIAGFSVNETHQEVACRIFADERLPCEYTIGFLEYLRGRNINRVYFMTSSEFDNKDDLSFRGLPWAIGKEKIRIVGVKNER